MEGSSKLASVPSGGGGGTAAAPTAGGAPAAAAVEEKKEEKVEEKVGCLISHVDINVYSFRFSGRIRRRHGLWFIRLIAYTHVIQECRDLSAYRPVM